MHPRLVIPANPCESFILRLAPRIEPLTVQAFHLERPNKVSAQALSQQFPLRLMDSIPKRLSIR